MNYIKEINAFYQRQETNPLSSSAANLWHTLIHVNNRCGWRETFTVAASVLCTKASLSSSTFKRARKELYEKGYIQYESRGGNRAAKYKIVSLVSATMDPKDDARANNVIQANAIVEPETNMRPEQTTNLDHSVDPLVKQEEIKQIPSTAAEEVIYFFKQNIGKLTPYVQNDLVQFVHDVGKSLVIAAIKRALDRGKRSWGYVKGILENWLAKGFKTAQETEEELTQFQGKQKPNRKISSSSREVIPDWFRNRNHVQQPKRKTETAEEAKERMEIEALLAKHA